MGELTLLNDCARIGRGLHVKSTHQAKTPIRQTARRSWE
jgi:hypothetical protein